MYYAYELYDLVIEELKRRNCAYPLTLAKCLKLTRAEVELAFWCMRKYGEAAMRNDGRWYYIAHISSNRFDGGDGATTRDADGLERGETG